MADWLSKAYWSAFTLWKMRKEKRLPYLPLQEILSIQNQRVKAIVKHAYETVPYYREVMDGAGLTPGDFQTADDLARLPILTGEQLASAPDRFLSRLHSDPRTLRLHTSGTTGESKYVYYDAAALFLAMANGHRWRTVLARFVGRTFGYRVMTTLHRDNMNFQLWDFLRAYSFMPRKIDLKRRNLSLLDSLEENIAQINIFKPDVILGPGSYVGSIFRHAWNKRLPISRPKAVAYGGDHMVEQDRRLVETEFGVPVLSSYQAAEALHMAFQCERREAFHISLDHVAVRVVDESGNTLGPGLTGEIVISNLTNRATVLLNYRLGDLVTMNSSPCPCGRTLPTLELIEGRSGDLVALPGGRVAPAPFILQKAKTVKEVVQLQLIQNELRLFVLNVVCAEDADWEQAQKELETALRSTLGDGISVAIKRVDAIPPDQSGKVKGFISHIPTEALLDSSSLN